MNEIVNDKLMLTKISSHTKLDCHTQNVVCLQGLVDQRPRRPSLVTIWFLLNLKKEFVVPHQSRCQIDSYRKITKKRVILVWAQ